MTCEAVARQLSKSNSKPEHRSSRRFHKLLCWCPDVVSVPTPSSKTVVVCVGSPACAAFQQASLRLSLRFWHRLWLCGLASLAPSLHANLSVAWAQAARNFKVHWLQIPANLQARLQDSKAPKTFQFWTLLQSSALYWPPTSFSEPFSRRIIAWQVRGSVVETIRLRMPSFPQVQAGSTGAQQARTRSSKSAISALHSKEYQVATNFTICLGGLLDKHLTREELDGICTETNVDDLLSSPISSQRHLPGPLQIHLLAPPSPRGSHWRVSLRSQQWLPWMEPGTSSRSAENEPAARGS